MTIYDIVASVIDIVLCETCGSSEIVRTRSSNFDKAVRWVTGRKRFSCQRCGWSALRAWDQMSSLGGRPTLVKSDPAPLDADDFDLDLDQPA